MPLVIHCPNCSTRYQVADSLVGQRVSCRQCQSTFTATASTTSPPPLPPVSKPPDSVALGGVTSALGLKPTPHYESGSSLGASAFSTPGWNQSAASARQTVSNPSGGPTDVQMRLVCGGMLGMGLILVLASFFLEAATGTVYLAAVLMVPLTLVVGIAGLISPNVVRAMGKYGGHLPFRYKALGWGLMGGAFLLMVVISIGIFVFGFRPERPSGGGGSTPGLTRAESDAVVERIRTSLAGSPNANVLRTVHFHVFATIRPNGVAEAERTLGAVPGYVPGSFHLSGDKKKCTFQYRGEREIAIQYALLLPGPTGIYIEFTPTFTEE